MVTQERAAGSRRNGFLLLALAVHWSTRLPFSQVFARLRWLGASPVTAFRLAQRAQRGVGDAGRPGACTRDGAYLRGYLRVLAYLGPPGPTAERRRRELVARGKIGLADLPAVRRLAGQP